MRWVVLCEVQTQYLHVLHDICAWKGRAMAQAVSRRP